MDPQLLDSLVCPECQGVLQLVASCSDQPLQSLICMTDQLRYPIASGIPVLLLAAASPCSEDGLLP